MQHIGGDALIRLVGNIQKSNNFQKIQNNNKNFKEDLVMSEKKMEVTKKIAIIGVGNCGSQVASLAEKKYPTIFDSVYINTSDTDLAMVSSEGKLKFKVGSTKDVEGSGKNREKMKEYLTDDLNRILGDKSLQECIVDKKYVFIVASMAGGTGSGAAPVLIELFRQLFPDVNFVLVGVLPKYESSLAEHANAIEFLNELYDILGEDTTYMIYDNETTSDIPSPTVCLEMVNENIVEDLRIISGIDNYPTQYESIDEADMESIVSTPGRLIVARINKNLTEKSMEDSKLDEMLIKSIKQSCHAETDRNKKVVRWGVITYFTDEVNRLYNSKLEGLRDFLGTPVERFNHNALNNGNENMNFIYLVAAGLSPINDRVKKTTELMETLKSSLPTGENKYILSGENTSYSVIEDAKKAYRRSKAPEQINTNDILAKFKKKDK